MDLQPIDFDAKFNLFHEHWQPKVIGRINQYLVKLAKVQGDFVWHTHPETDELFIVNKGVLRIDLRGAQVTLSKGQMYVVPKGVEHKPHADEECEIILFEPETTLNTGDAQSDMTVNNPEWI